MLSHSPSAQLEAFVGKIARDNKPNPANPEGYRHVPDRLSGLPYPLWNAAASISPVIED
jgi:hypothetical protein